MKTRKAFALLLSIIMVIASLGVYVPLATAAGGTITGSGTEANPYIISDVADFVQFRNNVNNGNDYKDKYIRLENDIDLSTVCGKNIGSWIPIGTESWVFSGFFDGAGHIVKNLWIYEPDKDDQALFFTSYVSIKNLGVTGTVVGNRYVGGLCATMTGRIDNCFSACTVTGKSLVGGLCGHCTYPNVYNCYNSGDVCGETYVGGIIGSLGNGSISNSYNLGNITGTSDVGGLTGYIMGSCNINAAYNTGLVTGSTYINAFVGRGNSSSENCYYLDNNAYTNSGTMLSAYEFTKAEYFVGFDFTEVWYMSPFLERPVLRAVREDGKGTEAEPYQISSASQLAALSEHVNSGEMFFEKHITLTKDIDLSTVCGDEIGSWTPIGTEYDTFSGTFNGNGFTVSGLWIDEPTADYCGLFGAVYGGALKNLGVSGSVKGKDYVGGLCGYAVGNVTECFNNCTVEGSNNVGGICGTSANIYDSYNSGAVSGTSKVGGLSGELGTGSILRSYNIGTVTGSTSAGGVVGLVSSGSVTSCYRLDTCGAAGAGDAVTKAALKDTASFPGFDFSSVWIINPVLMRPVLRSCKKYGSGTQNAPYTIENAEQLSHFRDSVNGGHTYTNEYISLVCDIDLSSVCSEGNNWTPIGVSGHNFYGTFDGNGFEISNLYINAPTADYQGLFAYIGGNIKNLSVSGSVTASNYVAGICTYLENGTITNCRNSCTVTGKNDVGGIATVIINSSIENCINTGAITGSSDNSNDVAGICAFFFDERCSISSCINTGTITGINYTGCIVGRFPSQPSESGYKPDVVNCYYKTDCGALGPGTMLSDEQFMLINSFTGFDFTNVWKMNGFYKRPELQIFDQFISGEGTEENPMLIKSAQQLCDFRDKANEGYSFEGEYVKLSKDIDLSSVCGADTVSWIPIGNDIDHMFSGVFDGNSFTISNLYINDSTADRVGLFSNNDGIIKNLTVLGNITGKDFVGGVCGYLYSGSVQGCKVNGTVTGASFVGGICGNMEFTSTIKGSTNNATITGYSIIGGICGSSGPDTEITACRSLGTVTGTGFTIGGLCGDFYGTITGCYNIGKVNGPTYVGGICGYNNAGRVISCHYLDTCAGEGTTFSNSAGSAKSFTQFTSGEVAFLLNLGKTDGTQMWYQNVDNDTVPDIVPLYKGATVYKISATEFSNSYSPYFVPTSAREGSVINETTIISSVKRSSSAGDFVAPEPGGNVLGTPVVPTWTFLGTGSTITVTDSGYGSTNYTLAVEADLNGDSLCDARDAMLAVLVLDEHFELSDIAKAAVAELDDVATYSSHDLVCLFRMCVEE